MNEGEAEAEGMRVTENRFESRSLGENRISTGATVESVKYQYVSTTPITLANSLSISMEIALERVVGLADLAQTIKMFRCGNRRDATRRSLKCVACPI